MKFRFVDFLHEDDLGDSNLTEIQAAEFADKGFIGQNDWVAHMMRYAFIQKTLERVQPKYLLDLGCGRMQLPYFLWRNRSTWKGNYIGIDARATVKWLDLINTHTAFESITLIRGSVLKSPGEYERFTKLNLQYDFIVCMEVLEHIANRNKNIFAFNISHWAPKGGHLYLSSPNTGQSESVAKNHIGDDGVREMTYNDKIALFEKHGFIQEAAYGTYIRTKYLNKEEMSVAEEAYHDYLTYPMYSAFKAIPYPAQATNAIHVFRRT